MIAAFVRKAAAKLVLWLTLLLVGVLAVPAGLLIGLIFLIWSAGDALIKKFDK